MRKDIPAKYLQINRSLKEQAKAFKDSPFNSSLQTTGNPRIRGYNHVRLSEERLFICERKRRA